MRSRLLRVLALVCVLGSVVVLTAPSSGAEGPQAVGWWSRQFPLQDDTISGQAAGSPVRYTAGGPNQVPPIPPETTVPFPVTTIPLPAQLPELPEVPITLPDPGTGAPNPAVPDGGLWVANDLTGPIAISALRFRGDIGQGELTLRFAPGSLVVGPIVACPALSDWSAGAAGAWRDRPAHDCDRFALSGVLQPDGQSMRWTIPQGFAEFGERVVDIVLMPPPGAGDLFSLIFEAPSADSFEVFAGQVLPPAEPELPDVPDEALPTVPESVAVDLPTGGDAGGSPTTVAPTPSIDVADDGQSPIARVLDPLTESRASRIIAMIVLLAMGAGLWYLGGQQVRAPRLIGGLAGTGTAEAIGVHLALTRADSGRGIGRFRRDRREPPTPF